MEKRLNHSHYVVFGLVLLVLVMGAISVARSDPVPNNFVGHGLIQIVNAQGVSVDANANGIIDVAENFTHWPDGQYCLLVHALPGPNMNCPPDFDGTRVEAAFGAGALTYDLCCR